MSEAALKVFLLAVGGMIIILPLKEMKKEYYNVSLAALGAAVVLLALKNLYPVVLFMKSLRTDTFSLYFTTMIKVIGITFISNLASELALDLGMSSVAGKVNFAGRVAVILASMPVFEKLFELVVAFS